MSRTFKDQPWKVQASKWNASNAEARHHHHPYSYEYEDVVDRYGNRVHEKGVEIIEYSSYFEYKFAKKRAGEEPVARELITNLHMHTSPYSHDRVLWSQRVKESDIYFTYSTRIYERVNYNRVVQRRVLPEIVCTIDEVPNGSNSWGDYATCYYYRNTPLKVVYAADRIERKKRSAKFNRSLSRNEMKNLENFYATGVTVEDEEEVDSIAHVVLRRNDWLG